MAPSTDDELLAACEWFVRTTRDDVARDGRPTRDAVAARCHLYRQLIDLGWTPSDKALALLRLHHVLMDVELDDVLGGDDERSPRR
jgi:hypothetical protein